MIDIRLPNITAPTSEGKLQQMQGYLQQLVEQLNWALNAVDNAVTSAEQKAVTAASAASDNNAVAQFNDIKGLIIKSADIVNAYYDTITQRLDGVYVAESDFGTFVENTNQTINTNSQYVENKFTYQAQVIAGVNSRVENVESNIKTGLLYTDKEGKPVYGLEIGQKNGDGFDAFARLAANKLSFYDDNGTEVAYISNSKLFINDLEAVVSMTMGKFTDIVQTDGSIVTKWGG
jgi:hypothetical protein